MHTVGFDGLGASNHYQPIFPPPDPNGSVGATQYLQWTNVVFGIFDKKNHSLVYGPAMGNTMWKGFTQKECETTNDGDPIVLYDKLAGRWLMTQFANIGHGPPFYQCIAVSTTSDALGTYARYAYKFENMNDYPKFGVWPDGYYATYNMFSGNTLLGGRVCAYERDAMLAGTPDAKVLCFDTAQEFGGVLPADVDGQVKPPNGTPIYLLSLGPDVLNLWRFHVDWSDPSAKSWFTGPDQIKVDHFNLACGDGWSSCVPQPQPNPRLSVVGDRLMYRLAYRRFSDHEALVVNHTVEGKNAKTVGIRWYELRPSNGTLKVQQQGTFSPDEVSRWMGSTAMDANGNLALGYSTASPTLFPSIDLAFRRAADPPHTLTAELQLLNGTGAQSYAQRWGDYSSLSLDIDDCTFWFTTEYVSANSGGDWSTFISNFTLEGCIPRIESSH